MSALRIFIIFSTLIMLCFLGMCLGFVGWFVEKLLGVCVSSVLGP